MDPEDLMPTNKPAKPKELTTLSEPELTAYIAALEAEIERARRALAAKKDQWGAAEALFRKG
ncbi:MAG TPA: DUF1192 domain-containing protein [Alphaproteobacteria bacterium]|nr:DUF1192 domain-containing protein [Alphaproteobacteria bacterium]